ncbi:MAG TPA: hypothetical protein VLV78_23585 [Thermoanaerobaculia bacterium]|nr:hypothetical protein [Thermoanaerobaculia bacterium]
MQPGDEEVVEIVNAAVDGVATPEQQAELQRLMATSPDVREMFESTREIAERLEAMNVEPPANLRSWSVAHLRATRAAGDGHRSTGRRTIFAAAWAAAAALILVFLIIGRQQMTDTGATMAPAWPVVERIASPDATLLVRRQGDMLSLEILVPQPETVRIAWDASQMTFVGVFDEKDASLGKASVVFSLRDPSQRAGVIVRPRGGASAAEVVVSVGRREVLRGVVKLN